MGKTTLHISIPEPCHEDWSNMTPTQCGAFCKACQKEVIDFSQMSEAEIVDRLSKASGRVCGRITANKLNRELVRYEPDNAWYSWKKWAVAAGVLLGVTNAHAEDGDKKNTDTVSITKDTTTRMLPELVVSTPKVENRIVCGVEVKEVIITQGRLVNFTNVVDEPKKITPRQRIKRFFLRIQRAFLKPKYR